MTVVYLQVTLSLLVLILGVENPIPAVDFTCNCASCFKAIIQRKVRDFAVNPSVPVVTNDYSVLAILARCALGIVVQAKPQGCGGAVTERESHARNTRRI